jgi:hypothetical protein
MNAIQKATFAVTALAITLAGAALVTAPMAFARPVSVVANSSVPGQQVTLIAFNRR